MIGLSLALLMSVGSAEGISGLLELEPVNWLDIALRNGGVALLLVAGGLLAALPTVGILAGNGFLVGSSLGVFLASDGGFARFLLLTVPHGVVELPALILFLKSSTAAYMGHGRNRLPCVYAGDVADLCIRAATTAEALGETYNAVNEEHVTQRDLLDAAAEITGVDPPRRSVPLRVLYAIAAGMEAAARLRGWSHHPDLTRFAVNVIGLDYIEDNSKARRELGWRAEISMREAVRRSVEWARERKRASVSG